jgi:hypothetical protein
MRPSDALVGDLSRVDHATACPLLPEDRRHSHWSGARLGHGRSSAAGVISVRCMADDDDFDWFFDGLADLDLMDDPNLVAALKEALPEGAE